MSGDWKFGAVLSSSAHLEPLESRSAACLMPSHLQSLYSCLPPCSASVSFQASIHSTKPVSTCYVPGAVPSAGHQQGFHNTWWPPGARWAHPTGGLVSCVPLSPPRSRNHPSPPLTSHDSPLSSLWGAELFLDHCDHGNLTKDSPQSVVFGNHRFLSGGFSTFKRDSLKKPRLP